VLLPARPARGGREAGRTARGADVLSAVGPVMVVSGGEFARGKARRYFWSTSVRMSCPVAIDFRIVFACLAHGCGGVVEVYTRRNRESGFGSR